MHVDFIPGANLDGGDWAIGCGDEVVTWSQAVDQITRLGNVLLAECQGGRIAVVGDNSAPTILAHAACITTGISSVGVNPRLRADELAHILRDADVRLCVVAPGAWAEASAAASGLGIRVLGWPGRTDYGDLHWDDAVAQASPSWTAAAGIPHRPVLYTSGTSGFPRGTEVQWTAEIGATVAEHLAHLRASMASVPEGPHLVVGPLYHNGPMMGVRAILDGRPTVVLPRFDAEDMLQAIDQRGIATTVCVPTHLSRLLGLDPAIRGRYDVTSMRSIRLTGAACPVPVKAGILAWFGPIVTETYGGTECHVVCSITAEESLRKPGSVGRAVQRYRVLVVDDAGDEVAAGVSGRLFFIDSLGRGVHFLNAPEKDAEVHLRPGVFTVGDIGFVDEDGYVFLNDRSVDMVISGGVNIYPAECERVLHEHPALADFAAVGLPDADMGERLVGVAVLRPGASVSPEELDAWCREHLASYKCPKEYRFVSTTGRNAVGKVSKRVLRAALLSDAPETALAAAAGR